MLNKHDSEQSHSSGGRKRGMNFGPSKGFIKKFTGTPGKSMTAPGHTRTGRGIPPVKRMSERPYSDEPRMRHPDIIRGQVPKKDQVRHPISGSGMFGKVDAMLEERRRNQGVRKGFFSRRAS